MTSSHKKGVGGSQKVTNDDEGGEGVSIPPKNDDVIYEQPLNQEASKILYVSSLVVAQQSKKNSGGGSWSSDPSA